MAVNGRGNQAMSGRVSIVTGASRGIGRAIAVELGKNGGQVIVNYAGRAEQAQETARLIEAQGGRAVVEQAEVGQSGAAERLVEVALQTFGRLDVVVNNAGITRDTLLIRMKDEDWDAVMNTNLKGAFQVIRAAARPMMKQRFGRIVNVASVVGIIGNAGQANYVAAKAGVIGLTKTAARELASRNITVNAVAPGLIQTDMTQSLGEEWTGKLLEQVPLGQIGMPDDVAGAVSWLVSDGARYVTGQVIHVDGGMVM